MSLRVPGTGAGSPTRSIVRVRSAGSAERRRRRRPPAADRAGPGAARCGPVRPSAA
ncbi:hypothetical protein H696_04166 [Fonticula alba]|uniref:Uncharacterized protein n=1 Tax=Fonticula alba TaxID=691883 RepID=A0A058Z891_FONAL|nr:hypothetical protein H696_04166 [Fonticula alba]KCV69757.1 hypothetical protein H696_04166 [Fonticula alba]|eukprot:XP_009496322.1 hypothetical protein H696_04166 [Fonticula alba]